MDLATQRVRERFWSAAGADDDDQSCSGAAHVLLEGHVDLTIGPSRRTPLPHIAGMIPTIFIALSESKPA